MKKLGIAILIILAVVLILVIIVLPVSKNGPQIGVDWGVDRRHPAGVYPEERWEPGRDGY